MNFERQKLGLTHDQHVESSNFDHSITTFLLIASYFLLHLRVTNILVKTLKKYKNMHSKEKLEIIPTFVGNRVPYQLAMVCVSRMDTSTISFEQFVAKKQYNFFEGTLGNTFSILQWTKLLNCYKIFGGYCYILGEY